MHGSSTVGDAVSCVLEIERLPEHLQEIASQVSLDDGEVGLEENETIHKIISEPFKFLAWLISILVLGMSVDVFVLRFQLAKVVHQQLLDVCAGVRCKPQIVNLLRLYDIKSVFGFSLLSLKQFLINFWFVAGFVVCHIFLN
jgi:hypothetical protein